MMENLNQFVLLDDEMDLSKFCGNEYHSFPFVADKLEEQKRKLWNALSFIGIENN